MCEIDLTEFLVKGRYREIKLGDSLERVKRILEPVVDGIIEEFEGDVLALSHSPFESQFEFGILVGFVFKSHNLDNNEYFKLYDHRIFPSCNLDEFLEILSSSDISWVVDTRKCTEKSIVLRTAIGSTVEFDLESNGTIINRLHMSENEQV